MKKWLVLWLSVLVVLFVVLVCVHADCTVCEVVTPVDMLGVQQ